jgi:hypothetical protein
MGTSEVIEAVQDARRIVSDVHENVIEYQKRLDAQIDSFMTAPINENQARPSSLSKRKSIDPAN